MSGLEGSCVSSMCFRSWRSDWCPRTRWTRGVWSLWYRLWRSRRWRSVKTQISLNTSGRWRTGRPSASSSFREKERRKRRTRSVWANSERRPPDRALFVMFIVFGWVEWDRGLCVNIIWILFQCPVNLNGINKQWKYSYLVSVLSYCMYWNNRIYTISQKFGFQNQKYQK